MKNKVLKMVNLGLISCFFTVSSAHAGFLTTDWLIVGDSKSVLHEETGIEWMRYSETQGLSIDSVELATQKGGVYYGWRLPTYMEVIAMFSEFKDPFLSSGWVGGTSNSMSTGHIYNNFEQARVKMASVFGGYYLNHATLGYRWITSFKYKNEEGVVVKLGYEKARHPRSYSSGINGYLDYAGNFSSNDAVFLVNDGGVTLSSKEQPSLNANNENSPYSVSAPFSIGSLIFGSVFLLTRRISKRKNT